MPPKKWFNFDSISDEAKQLPSACSSSLNLSCAHDLFVCNVEWWVSIIFNMGAYHRTYSLAPWPPEKYIGGPYRSIRFQCLNVSMFEWANHTSARTNISIITIPIALLMFEVPICLIFEHADVWTVKHRHVQTLAHSNIGGQFLNEHGWQICMIRWSLLTCITAGSVWHKIKVRPAHPHTHLTSKVFQCKIVISQFSPHGFFM